MNKEGVGVEGIENENLKKNKTDNIKDKQMFHGWVYVEVNKMSFFLEATTGAKHSIYSKSYIRSYLVLPVHSREQSLLRPQKYCFHKWHRLEWFKRLRLKKE